ncbi:hypothetical protein [Sodalis sp. dw_96]|uniref:hypothetical protein n=1 Tax=Sodalis sp. dw_96 TaxID=2719794 RepID=UPI001BD3C756|nr:hypothetical protein [Sodalis sp. dw_96]
MIPFTPFPFFRVFEISSKPPENKKNKSLGYELLSASNFFRFLSEGSPATLELIFSNLPRKDYSNLREVLVKNNYDINCLALKYRHLYNEIIVNNNESALYFINDMNSKLAVCNEYQTNINLDIDMRISISLRYYFLSQNNVFKNLFSEINNQLLQKNSSEKNNLYVMYTTLFSSAFKENAFKKIIVIKAFFENQETATPYLRGIMDGAEKTLKKQKGNDRLLCAMIIMRFIDMLKKENLSHLHSDEIVRISHDYPYLVNFIKALKTLYPEVSSGHV